MKRVRPLRKKLLWAAPIALSLGIVTTAFLAVRESLLFNDCLFLAVIVAVFPPAVLEYMESRRSNSIDEHLPDLFRTIVQAQETGMTLPQALQEASKRDYGPLTSELEKTVNQMSWGLPFEEALQGFCERTDTRLVQRTAPLIIEASNSGGDVERIFKPMAGFIGTTLSMQKERRAQTRPYIAIVYIAFFVFIFTIILLLKAFFVEMGGSAFVGSAGLESAEAQNIFFHMTLIQGFFGGLVAGKMGEGTLGAGLKHITILTITGYLALRLTTW